MAQIVGLKGDLFATIPKALNPIQEANEKLMNLTFTGCVPALSLLLNQATLSSEGKLPPQNTLEVLPFITVLFEYLVEDLNSLN